MAKNVGGIDFKVGIDADGAITKARIDGEAIGHELKKGVDGGSGGISSDIGKLFDELAPNARKNLRSVSVEFDKSTASADRFRKSVAASGSSSTWNKLSTNGRQAVLIVATVMSAATDLANLSIAAGGGISILGAGLADLSVGAGVAIAGFVELNRGVAKVPAALKPAAGAFADLKKELKSLQDDISLSMFKDSVPAFKSLTDTVKALSPALQVVGSALGDVLGKFAKGVAPGTQAFTDLNNLILQSAPNLQKMASAAGKLGSALLSALANKSVQKGVGDLADALGRVGDSIQKFVNDGGLDTWMKRTETIFSHVTPLFIDAGKAIGSLVTDTSINRLNNFLDAVDSFINTTVGPLLAATSQLNVFGLIAQTLDQLGKVLTPLIGPIGQLFDGLQRVVSIAIGEWGKQLTPIAKDLAPIVSDLGSFFKTLDPNLIKLAADMVLALAAGFVVLRGTKGLAGVVGGLKGVSGQIKKVGNEAETSAGKLGKFGSVAGGLGAGAIGGTIGGDVGKDAAKKLGANPDWQQAGKEAGGLFGGALSGAAFGPIGILAGAVSGLLSTIDWSSWVNGAKQIGDAFTWLGTTVGDFANGPLKSWEQQTVGMFADFGTNTYGMFADFISNTVGMFVDFFTNTVGMFVDFFNNTVGMFTDFGVNAWNAITGVFSTVATWIMDNVVTPIINFFAGIPGAIGAFLGGIGDTIGSWFNSAVNWVANVYNQIIAWFASLPGAIGSFIGGIGDTIGSWFNNAVAWVSNVYNQIISFFSGIPGAIGSFIGGIGATIGGWFNSAVSQVSGVVDNIVGFFQKLPGRIMSFISGLGGKIASALNLGGLIPKTATGGLFMGPQTRIIGEAGPEMVVPLTRPLNQVDPAVRSVAAFAQGKSTGDGGGGPSIGKQVNVEQGAIVVTGVNDGALAATTALDEAVRKF